ncbi:hypothetical protein ACWIG5_17405 [Streptomyces lydicus]
MTTTPQTLGDAPVRVAVRGGNSRRTRAGSALRDVIHECGRGRRTRCLADAGEPRKQWLKGRGADR